MGCSLDHVDKLCIWGNHSPTMYPDTTNLEVKGERVGDQIDKDWLNEEFIPRVQKRGAEVIGARGLSSAASAGNAAISHMRDWVLGTGGKWTSMSIRSNGEYGVEKGLIFSFPVVVKGGKVKIVEGLELTDV